MEIVATCNLYFSLILRKYNRKYVINVSKTCKLSLGCPPSKKNIRVGFMRATCCFLSNCEALLRLSLFYYDYLVSRRSLRVNNYHERPNDWREWWAGDRVL